MERICLSSDGLFPMVDRSGLSALGLPVSGTLQGEGMLCGVPSLFLRLAGCNLRCAWRAQGDAWIGCDTPQALETSSGQWVGVDCLAEAILQHLGALDHLVITGGEPVLQAAALGELLDLVRTGWEKPHLHITMESNGSIFSRELAEWIDLISLSPKLNAHRCGYRVEHARYLHSVQSWLDTARSPSALQLKFVVSRPTDDELIEEQYLSKLVGWDRFPVLVMPLGADGETLARSQQAAVGIAIRRNWRYSPRLHIDLWGSRLGV